MCTHCTCISGVLESSTHIGTPLFKIEVAVQIRGTKTVSDIPAKQIIPTSVDKVQADVGYEIDLSSSAAKKKALDNCISEERRMSRIQTHVHCSLTTKPKLLDLSPLFQTFKTHSTAFCLSGMVEYYYHYTDPVKPCVVAKALTATC